MKYSFIVPVYNVENYIDRCLNSILSQSFNDYELLLINDGSTDNSFEICMKYAKQDKRIKLFDKPNGGLSDARNFGLDRAKGEYVIFVDSDDYIEKNTCITFYDLTLDNIDIIRGNAFVITKDDRSIMRNNTFVSCVCSGQNYLKHSLALGEMSMAVWLNIYRRDFLNKNDLRFKVGVLHEDEEFSPRAFLAAKSVVDTGIPFYNYVIRSNSITTKKDKRQNAKDLLSFGFELESIYKNISDRQLKRLLRDTLVSRYLSVYQDGNLRKHGNEFLPRLYLLRNAKTPNTIIKAILVCISPGLYSVIHNFIKGC